MNGLRDLTGAKQNAVQHLSGAVTQGNPSLIAESQIYKGGQTMPPRGAPNPMELHHRPVPTGQDLMHEFQQNRAKQQGPMPMPAPMVQQQHQQQMINDQLNKEFNNLNISKTQNNKPVINAGPKGPMQVRPHGPPMMYGPPPQQMFNNFYGPQMMQPQFPMQMQQPMPQQLQQPQPKQELKENTDKTEEGISTNGEQDMKDEKTVEDELRNLNPTQKDKEAISELLNSTQHDPKMQNSQFFNLLRKIQEKPAVEENKTETDRLNEEFKDWKNDTRLDDADWQSYMDAINPTAVEKTNDPQYSFIKENHFMIQQQPLQGPLTEQEEKSNSNNNNKSEEYFKEGLRLMKEGNLNEAILAFEACVQIEKTRSEAWRYLGICHADNENENSGIAAFLKCIENDPYDLDALLQLGVSYTNEIDPLRALKYLRSWIANHADYSVLNGITQENNLNESKEEKTNNVNSFMGSRREHRKIVDLFNKALGINSKDADLHIVLGVLYNITSDYDKAEFHFKKAIQSRPKDPSLWNKLGATQANGQRCNEAIKAYSKALQLKPNYVRALSNLGISFANQGMHREACQSYLASLDRNPSADSVWDHLTMSLLHMNRSDLVALCEKRDPKLFKNYFRF